jgi:DNA-binding transcriptional MerR regulator
MRIGALAARSGVSTRMLRYYHQQGLLVPSRGPNGYRHYQDSDVVRAQLVSSLIRSGLPTRLISVMLDDETDRSRVDTSAVFEAELARLESRLACLTLSRDSVRRYLQEGPEAVLRQNPANIAAAALDSASIKGGIARSGSTRSDDERQE